MTSHLARAFDRRRACGHQPEPSRILPLRQPVAKRALPIREALEWAFGAECASLDFAEDKGDNVRPGVSPLWTVMQRGALGCSIDGGGHSLPAHDADIIASAVANLPRDLGGRGMAVQIAELARAGAAPDWGADLRPRCIPVGWKGENQTGPQAVTEVVRIETVTLRGRSRDFPVLACPVTYTASPARIMTARRQYLEWVEALAWLAEDLTKRGILDRVTIAPCLPEAEPWARVADERRAG